jgi:hypothetical protein
VGQGISRDGKNQGYEPAGTDRTGKEKVIIDKRISYGMQQGKKSEEM